MKARSVNRQFLIDLTRAFGGSLILALPLLMTSEMWALGFSMDRLRLALFLLICVVLLVGLAHHWGFEESRTWRTDVLDAFVAYAVAFVASATIFCLLAVLRPGMQLDEVLGKITLQSIPGGIGAIMARTLLSGIPGRETERTAGGAYAAELLFMSVGAVYFAINVAPTEEIMIIAFKMTSSHAAALAILCAIMMHAIVYQIEFKGQAAMPTGMSFCSIFLRFSVVGYGLVLLLSCYVLWTFGRTDGLGFPDIIKITIVLAFPASFGAAVARLIL